MLLTFKHVLNVRSVTWATHGGLSLEARFNLAWHKPNLCYLIHILRKCKAKKLSGAQVQ